jgi:myo-inositol-1(or 4)-monophosphatase
MTAEAPAEELLARIEATAVTLAQEAGTLVTAALERELQVDYKPQAGAKPDAKETHNDPVSEVDHAVEALLRERIAAEFPEHLVLGEEVDSHPDAEAEWVWVVDPVDGTANFINGFPLFAVSVGVLHLGRPVVGAVWCATTQALRAGVYHAHEGGALFLDSAPVAAERATKVKRALAAAPGGSSPGTRMWDHRVTGSMAIEAAYVAAGIFASAPFWGPKIWDIAGGIPLIRASGREVWLRDGSQWVAFERFTPPKQLPRRRNAKPEDAERTPSLRDWRGSVIVGTSEATQAMRERVRPPSMWRRALRSSGMRLRGRRHG